MKKIKNNKGFSLVELIVVIAIMAVLVGVIAPTLIQNIEKSRESKDIQALDSIAAAAQLAVATEKGSSVALDTANAYDTGVDFITVLNTDDGFANLIRENLVGNTAKIDVNNGGVNPITFASKTCKNASKIIISVATDGKVTVKAVDSSGNVLTTKNGDDFSVTR